MPPRFILKNKHHEIHLFTNHRGFNLHPLLVGQQSKPRASGRPESLSTRRKHVRNQPMNTAFNILAIFVAIVLCLFLGPVGFLLVGLVLVVWVIANIIEAIVKPKPRNPKLPPPLPRNHQ
jgi:hypothetical protein